MKDQAATASRAVLTRWQDLKWDAMRGSIERRFITTPHVMVAQVQLKRGDVVPRHQHRNEQITYVLSGALEFWLGDQDEQHVVVKAGEVLTIPGDLSHRAFAVDDTLEIDIFNPPRQDWLEGTDAYLRT